MTEIDLVVNDKEIGDGNCFYHSILTSLYKEYVNGSHACKTQMAADLKNELHKDFTFIEWENLSNGMYKELDDKNPGNEFSYSKMKNMFTGDIWADVHIMECVAKKLEIDLYIIEMDGKGGMKSLSNHIGNINTGKRTGVVVSFDNGGGSKPGHYQSVSNRETDEHGKITFKRNFPPGHNVRKKIEDMHENYMKKLHGNHVKPIKPSH
jgi:hypothetical protein